MSTELLSTIRGSGVEIWATHGKLRYRAPAGVMTDDLKQRLRQHKGELLELLNPADIETPRTEAEQQAAARVFEYKLDGWGQWGVLLGQPGGTLHEAERWCRERFGEKLVDVRPYRSGNHLATVTKRR